MPDRTPEDVPTVVREAGVPPEVWAAAVERAEQGAIVRTLRDTLQDQWWRARVRLPSVTIGGVTLAGGEYEVRAVIVLVALGVVTVYALPLDVRTWLLYHVTLPPTGSAP